VYQHLIDEQREDAARALDAYLERPPARTNEAAKAGAKWQNSGKKNASCRENLDTTRVCATHGGKV
jgi:hypothetical protein